MSVTDLGVVLKTLKINTVESFKEHAVDGQLLECMEDTILKTEFNLSDFEVLKLRRFMGGWVPKK